MVTRYDILKDLDLLLLVSSGIVSISIANWFEIYKTYLDEINENQKSIAIQFTADYWNISERNVYKIIAYFEQSCAKLK